MIQATSRIQRFYNGLRYDDLQRYTAPILLVLSFAIAFIGIWIVSGPDLTSDVFWRVIKPAIRLDTYLNGGDVSLWPILQAGPTQSGHQFFMYPVMALFGWGFLPLKFVAVFVQALTAPVLFLAFRRYYGTRVAATLTGMLLTTEWFLSWRSVDYHFQYLLAAAALYLFIRWQESSRPRYLYSIAGIMGIGLYLKASILYIGIGLAAGALVMDRDRIRSVMTLRSAIISGCVFFIASLPWWAYQAHTGLPVLQSLLHTPSHPSFMAAGITRLQQVSLVTAILIPASQPTALATIGRHIYLLPFIAGAILSIWSQRGRTFLLAFTTILLISLYSPNGNIAPHHIAASILPLFLLITGKTFATLQESGKSFRYLFTVAPVILLLLFVAVVPQVHQADYVTSNAYTAEQIADMERLNLTGPVATNYRDIYFIAHHNRDITSVTMLDEPDDGCRMPILCHQMGLDRFSTGYSRNTTLLLLHPAERDPAMCAAQHSESRCGYTTETVLQAAGIPSEDTTAIQIGRQSFLIVHNEARDDLGDVRAPPDTDAP